MNQKDYDASKKQFYVEEGIITGGKMYEAVVEYTEPQKNDDGTIEYITKTLSRYADTKEEAEKLRPFLEQEVAGKISQKNQEIVKKLAEEQAKKKHPSEPYLFGHPSTEQKKYQAQLEQELEKSIKGTITSSEARRITDLVIDTKESMIGRNAFKGKGLRSVTFGPNITVISRGSFKDNELEEVIFSPSLCVIGEGAFANNNLKKAYIPQKVTSINGEAFENNKLEDVTFDPNSETTYIGTKAFANNNIKHVILPGELTRIYADSFDETVEYNNVQGSIVLSERRR